MAKRGNGKGTLSQGKDGYWRGKIYLGKDEKTGKGIYKSFSGKSKTKVENDMKEFRANYYDLKDEIVRKVKTKDDELEKEINKWIVEVKKMKLKPTSLARLVATVNNQIIPYIGKISVNDITTEIVQKEVINKLYKEGLSLSTIKKAKHALSDYYDYWRRIRMTETNKYIPNIIDMVELPSEHQFDAKEIKVMNDDQVQLFIETMFKKNPGGGYIYKNADLINLILQTGIRVGEACAIEIGDYNKQEKSLLINKNAIEIGDTYEDNGKIIYDTVKVIYQDTPKTGSGYRKLPLNDSAILSIERLIKDIKKLPQKTNKIATMGNMEPIRPKYIIKTINRIYDAAGIDLSGAHSLRHTYATALFNQGIELKTVSSLLGHSGIQITADTYVHYLETMKYSKSKKLKFKPYPEYLL